MKAPNSEFDRDIMSEKRRSKEEFEAFLKSLFEKDSPKVKYQNPERWRIQPQNRGRNSQ
jgi:hypothetical protein